MEERIIHCIAESNVQKIVKKANELAIAREDIIAMFTLGGQVYLVYYR